MGILGIITLIILVILIVVISVGIAMIVQINERNQSLYGEIFDRLHDLEESSEGYVTDPFEKPVEKFSSTAHVIQRKTPDQIRNENFKKIVEEGKSYGDTL